MKISLVLIVSWISLVSCLPTEDCRKGQEYWCRNEETAFECGAINICGFEKQSSTSGYVKFTPPNSNQVVNVTLYFEALCPDCKQIWEYQLYPTFQKLQSSGILHVDLVPYGNAQERAYGSQWIYYCQHGQAECVGNLIETCVLKHYPDQNQYIPVIHCLDHYGPTQSNLAYCASLQKLDSTVIQTCSQGSEGNQAEHEMALRTQALNPPHQYVPWFTLNGYHDQTVQQELSTNMLVYVCSVYTGTKPAACL